MQYFLEKTLLILNMQQRTGYGFQQFWSKLLVTNKTCRNMHTHKNSILSHHEGNCFSMWQRSNALLLHFL